MDEILFNENDVNNQIKRIVFNAKKCYVLITSTFDSAMANLDREDYIMKDNESNFTLNLKRFERDAIIESVTNKIVNPSGISVGHRLNNIEVVNLVNKVVEKINESNNAESKMQAVKMQSALDNELFINQICKESDEVLNKWLASYRSNISIANWPSDFSKYSKQLKEELREYFLSVSNLSKSQVNGIIDEMSTKMIDNDLIEKSIRARFHGKEDVNDETRKLKTESFNLNVLMNEILDRTEISEEDKNALSLSLKDKLFDFYNSKIRGYYYSEAITKSQRENFINEFKNELQMPNEKPNKEKI